VPKPLGPTAAKARPMLFSAYHQNPTSQTVDRIRLVDSVDETDEAIPITQIEA